MAPFSDKRTVGSAPHIERYRRPHDTERLCRYRGNLGGNVLGLARSRELKSGTGIIAYRGFLDALNRRTPRWPSTVVVQSGRA
jgi:hypothetical protein